MLRKRKPLIKLQVQHKENPQVQLLLNRIVGCFAVTSAPTPTTALLEP